MFEDTEKDRPLKKNHYKRRLAPLRVGLLQAQRAQRRRRFPVLVVIAGMDGAGKGETANLLYEWLDPHFLDVHGFGEPSDEERERPYFWRFWRTVPAAGSTAVYVGSWYSDCLARYAAGELGETELARRLEQIRSFERMLAAEGALVVKFWLHLDREAQERRLAALAADPETAWRVTGKDRQHLAHYRPFRRAAERILRETDTESSPWTIVDAAHRRRRNLRMGAYLLQRLEARLQRRAGCEDSAPPALSGCEKNNPLRALNLRLSLAKPDYRRDLAHYRGRLGRAAREAVHRGISSIVVLEGRDAGGKGGIIRRLLPALDARFCRVIPVGPPTGEEQAYHYLWRFWRHIPPAGGVTIYDRSWYGRVLVERVEGLAYEREWARAYREIREFEAQLTDAGIILVKFWLEISPDEQHKRFEKREQVPFKQYKITGEDYRNRARWNEYGTAAAEMIRRTGTDSAPWTLIEGNDKRFARIKALRTWCERLEAALGRSDDQLGGAPFPGR